MKSPPFIRATRNNLSNVYKAELTFKVEREMLATSLLAGRNILTLASARWCKLCKAQYRLRLRALH